MKKFRSKFQRRGILSLTMLILVLLCTFSVTGIHSEAASKKTVQKKISLSKTKLNLVTNRSYYLKLNNAKGKITWNSSDKSVATVTKTGKVSAVAAGKCTITAKNQKKTYSCAVQVLNISVESLKKSYSSKSKLERGKVLLAGSSTLDYWSGASAAFYPYEVQNMAIAGSTVTEWQSWYSQLITPYKPSAIVLYVGTNDLAMGKSWESTLFATWDLIEKIQKKLPNTPIYYVSMCPCERRSGLWQSIAYCNKYMKKYCGWNKNLYYISLTSHFTKNGAPRTDLFLPDKLHPNTKGYAVWKKIVAGTVKKRLKAK